MHLFLQKHEIVVDINYFYLIKKGQMAKLRVRFSFNNMQARLHPLHTK